MTIPATIYTPPRRTVDDIPVRPLARIAIRLYLVGALAWDYADTILDIAASMRLAHTRRHSREVRQLRLDYDRARQYLIDPDHVAKETELSLIFESIAEPTLTKLNDGLVAELASFRLSADHAILIRSVQIAMTLLDVMKQYAVQCDTWIKSFGVNGHSILDKRFVRLAATLPHFAGQYYDPASPSRREAARHLLADLLDIEVHHTP